MLRCCARSPLRVYTPTIHDRTAGEPSVNCRRERASLAAPLLRSLSLSLSLFVCLGARASVCVRVCIYSYSRAVCAELALHSLVDSPRRRRRRSRRSCVCPPRVSRAHHTPLCDVIYVYILVRAHRHTKSYL